MMINKNMYVTILLCTYNGDLFLQEQLESIERQTVKNWKLIISDDGSIDNTIKIIKKFQMKWSNKKVQIRYGPKDGYAANFLSLMMDPGIQNDFFAFCDQDDIWFPEKLERAISLLQKNKKVPSLYGSKSIYINAIGKIISSSPYFKGCKDISNALIQNFAGGNTMVFNQKAKKSIERFNVRKIISHDWWAYIVICSVNGKIIYDKKPYIYYRQHNDNVIGGKVSFLSKNYKLLLLILGELKNTISENIDNLKKNNSLLSEKTIIAIEDILKIRQANVFLRLWFYSKSLLNRQTYLSRLSILLCVFLNKM